MRIPGDTGYSDTVSMVLLLNADTPRLKDDTSRQGLCITDAGGYRLQVLWVIPGVDCPLGGGDCGLLTPGVCNLAYKNTSEARDPHIHEDENQESGTP